MVGPIEAVKDHGTRIIVILPSSPQLFIECSTALWMNYPTLIKSECLLTQLVDMLSHLYHPSQL